MNTKTKKSKNKKVKVSIPTISFGSWFWFKEREGLVRSSDQNGIKIFFKSKGLKDEEQRFKYDETLKLY